MTGTSPSSLLAEDLMTSHAVPLQKGVCLGKDLGLQLLSGLFSGWPVVNEGHEIVGIVTERDVLKVFTQGLNLMHVRPEDIMSTPPIYVGLTDTLPVVLKAVFDQELSRIPVVSGRRLVGVVSRADLLRYLVAPEIRQARYLPCCYWCERVKDSPARDATGEQWCELQDFLFKHQLDSQGVSLAPTYCPQCFELVKKTMNGTAANSLSDVPQKTAKKTILVVDDERSILLFVEQVLNVLGFDAITAQNGREGLHVVEQVPVDGIILDLDMPIMDGRTMLDELRWLGYEMPVIAMSGGTNTHGARALLEEGAQELLQKPFEMKHFEKICQQVFGSSREQASPGHALSCSKRRRDDKRDERRSMATHGSLERSCR